MTQIQTEYPNFIVIRAGKQEVRSAEFEHLVLVFE